MSIEFLSELENKIDVLITTLEQTKGDNLRLNQENEQVKGRLAELELQNQTLGDELASLRNDSDSHRQKLSSAADRIQNLLTKLESVQ